MRLCDFVFWWLFVFAICPVYCAYGAQIQRKIVAFAETGMSAVEIHTIWCPLVAVETIRRWIRFKQRHGVVPAEMSLLHAPRLKKRMPVAHASLLIQIVQTNSD